MKALEIINGTYQDCELYPESFRTGWEPSAKQCYYSLSCPVEFRNHDWCSCTLPVTYPLAMITKCLQGKAIDIVKAFKDIEAVDSDFHASRSGVVE